MNYFFVIFLLYAVEPLRGRVFNTSRTDILASVKEYPSFLHKCTATFIRGDVLLTSAYCLFCEGHCTLFVEAGTEYLSVRSSTAKLYSVQYTVIHPEFEPSPEQNDIGLIKLKELVTDAAVFDLPLGYVESRGIEANTFAWKFSEDGREFQLHFSPAVGVSKAMCSLALNHYVDFPYVCALGKTPFSFGIFDNGSPLVGKIKGFWVLLGIYVRHGVYREAKIEIFQSVVPYLDWINQMLERTPEVLPVTSNNNSFASVSDNAPFAPVQKKYLPYKQNPQSPHSGAYLTTLPTKDFSGYPNVNNAPNMVPAPPAPNQFSSPASNMFPSPFSPGHSSPSPTPNKLPSSPASNPAYPHSNQGFIAPFPKGNTFAPPSPDESSSGIGNNDFHKEDAENFYNPLKVTNGSLLKRME